MIQHRPPKTEALRAATRRLSGQPLRLVEYLAAHGSVLTGELAAAIACGNISQAAARANQELERYGLRVVARLPDPLATNRFGEPSMAHMWSIERLPEGAAA